MASSHGKARRESTGRVLLRVRVQPGAARNGLLREADGRLRVRLTAPPVEGAANRALCALLASTLHLPKSAVTIVAGAKSRDKTVCVDQLDAAAVAARLEEQIPELKA